MPPPAKTSLHNSSRVFRYFLTDKDQQLSARRRNAESPALIRAAARQKVCEQRKDCAIKRRVAHDRNAQEPAKRPREGAVGIGHNQLGNLQTW